MLQHILLTAAVLLHLATGLDNGLALTPPMGWLTWERFRCNTDCKNQPDSCISEHLIKTMANLMVKDGYLEAGYKYIMIDDCWLAKERTKFGKLQPDPDRFPSGIPALVDYVHNLGLKFGIYEDFGTRTCAGYPGSEFYLQMDATTFAEWGVDFVKFDGCYSDPRDLDVGYETFGFYLNKTGRPMVYSCELPLHQRVAGIKPNYTAIQRICNLWRNYDDIEDTWDSVQSVIKYYGNDDGDFSSFAKPGAWNDPDEIKGTVIEVWLKPLSIPSGSFALAFVQLSNPGDQTFFTVRTGDVGLMSPNGYKLTDGFTGEKEVTTKGPDSELRLLINPNGVILLVASPFQ